MKTSERLKSILCNPEGMVCIDGTDADRVTLQMAINEVEFMENEIENNNKEQAYMGHPEFFNIIEKMKDIHSNKSHDYAGTGGDPFANLKLSTKMGIPYWKGCLVRIGDKFSRLCSFARQGDLKVKDESIEDTLIDLANYSVICLILYREGKQEKINECNKNS